jgi:hypothetical protein
VDAVKAAARGAGADRRVTQAKRPNLMKPDDRMLLSREPSETLVEKRKPS